MSKPDILFQGRSNFQLVQKKLYVTRVIVGVSLVIKNIGQNPCRIPFWLKCFRRCGRTICRGKWFDAVLGSWAIGTIPINLLGNEESIMPTPEQCKATYHCGIGKLLTAAYRREFTMQEMGRCKRLSIFSGLLHPFSTLS